MCLLFRGPNSGASAGIELQEAEFAPPRLESYTEQYRRLHARLRLYPTTRCAFSFAARILARAPELNSRKHNLQLRVLNRTQNNIDGYTHVYASTRPPDVPCLSRCESWRERRN